jgi:hypothetical protein
LKKTALKNAQGNIASTFMSLPQKVFKQKDISIILEQNKTKWKLAQSTTITKFLQFLVDEMNFRKVVLDFPFRKETRYILEDVSIYRVLLELKPTAYFSHFTAMFFNELTEQVPKTIYLNNEQVEKGGNSKELEQDAIKQAFSRPVRVTSNFTSYEGTKIYMLNGQNTGNLGVININNQQGETLRVTNIERTIIDMTVRPVYSGGIFEVFKAYKKAAGVLSVNKLISYLKKINYTYPYHQAIGFYLEKSGSYSPDSIDLIRKLEIKYDFYLTHNMQELEYSSKWKLFYPKGFE